MQTATRPSTWQWYGVGAVTLGIFAIATTEILPIGLLDDTPQIEVVPA